MFNYHTFKQKPLAYRFPNTIHTTSPDGGFIAFKVLITEHQRRVFLEECSFYPLRFNVFICTAQVKYKDLKIDTNRKHSPPE